MNELLLASIIGPGGQLTSRNEKVKIW